MIGSAIRWAQLYAQLPFHIVEQLFLFLFKNYPGVTVVSIYKRNAGYDIGLSDHVKLRFNLLGQFKGVQMEDE